MGLILDCYMSIVLHVNVRAMSVNAENRFHDIEFTKPPEVRIPTLCHYLLGEVAGQVRAEENFSKV